MANLTVEHLDNRRRKVSKSTWTRNETLGILDDDDESAESEDLSDDSNWTDSSSCATGNTHGVTAASADTGTPRIS